MRPYSLVEECSIFSLTTLKLWLLTAVLGYTSFAGAQESVPENASVQIDNIRQCARANLPDSSFHQQLELSSWDAAGGVRSLLGRLYGKADGAKRVSLMLSIDEPADLAGARYLLNRRAERENMFVYLPAMARTRRIMGGMKGQPLWGTDFSYEDIKHLQSSLSEPDTEYLGSGERAGRSIHSLRVIPMAESESAYTAIEMDVDQETCLLLQARFFDSSGVFKRMDSDPAGYSQVGQRWVPGLVTIENLRTQTRSALKMADFVFDEKFSNNYFNPKAFHLSQ